MMKLKKYLAAVLLWLSLIVPVVGAEIWISTTGNDNYPGTREHPKQTLQAALRLAREMRRLRSPAMEEGIHIILREGTYRLYEPLCIRPEDSGGPKSPTVIRGAEGEKVIVSGGMPITGWKREGNYWVANVPDFNGRPVDFRQLWINGRKAVRARDVDDFEKMHRILGNDPGNQVLWVPAEAVKPVLNAPYPEMVLHQMWALSFLRIKSIELHSDSAAIRFHHPESKLQFDHPWPSPVTTPGHESPFYLTNARELLDKPGEWFHDFTRKKLFYLPGEGVIPEQMEAVIPVLETLIRVEGTLDRPVQHLSFRNIQFSHTTWMRPSEKGHVALQAGMYLTEAYRLCPPMKRADNNHDLDNQGWLGRPPAAILVEGTANISFSGCRFTHLASTGVDYATGNKGGRIEGSLFRDIGGNGVVAGSFSPSSHETHFPYRPQDEREVTTGLQVVNNLFEDVANEDWGAVAIAAGYVNGVNIEHNEIREISYSGISLGWGWNCTPGVMGNNRVHANHIWRYARHMYDVAGIYTLGWQPGTYITQNSVHDIYRPGYVHIPTHWFYLYTDEGSSGITVRDNWTEQEKFLQNANGPGNLWENNGPMVHDSVRQNAGLTKEFRYLLEK